MRDRAQSVKFMLIVTEPPNVSTTREVIKISREFTEVTALSCGARAPHELAETDEIESDQATATCVAYASTRAQKVVCRS